MAKKLKDSHMMIRMDLEMKDQIDEVAERMGVSRTTLVRMAIKHYLGEVGETTIPIPKERE